MNLGEELKRIIKKCDGLSFNDKIQFLVKTAEETKSKELKIVLYFYVNHLIKQKNTRGTQPFVLPPLSEVRRMASRLKDEPRLQDALSGVNAEDAIVTGGSSLYEKRLSKSSVKTMYSDDRKVPDFYKEEYIPGRREREQVRVETPDRESDLEVLADGDEEDKSRFNDDKKKKEEKEKLLY